MKRPIKLPPRLFSSFPETPPPPKSLGVSTHPLDNPPPHWCPAHAPLGLFAARPPRRA